MVLVMTLVAAGAASALAWFQAGVPDPAPLTSQAPSRTGPEFEKWWLAFPRTPVPVPANGAAVLIVKFTDFQCPSCGQTFLAYGPILAKYQARYPGKVKFLSKDYPLQPDCNVNVRRMVHQAACDAAVAIRLAAERGRGDALEHYFYTHQSLLTPATVREYAATVGNVQDLDAGYQRALDGVKADIALARLLGLHATPTFFLNGVRFEGGALTPEEFDQAIAYELKKAGVGR
jgi:predicted DsbA family dithiol-disulfide isomerase